MFADFKIICADQAIYTSKALLANASPWFYKIFEAAEQDGLNTFDSEEYEVLQSNHEEGLVEMYLSLKSLDMLNALHILYKMDRIHTETTLANDDDVSEACLGALVGIIRLAKSYDIPDIHTTAFTAYNDMARRATAPDASAAAMESFVSSADLVYDDSKTKVAGLRSVVAHLCCAQKDRLLRLESFNTLLRRRADLGADMLVNHISPIPDARATQPRTSNTAGMSESHQAPAPTALTSAPVLLGYLYNGSPANEASSDPVNNPRLPFGASATQTRVSVAATTSRAPEVLRPREGSRSGGLFDSRNSLFNPAPSAPSGGLFGAAPRGGLFGSAPSGGLFGSAPSGGLFGAAPTSSLSGFGSGPGTSTRPPHGALFGDLFSSTPGASSSGFGYGSGSSNRPSDSASSGGLFGSTSSARPSDSASSGGLFGSGLFDTTRLSPVVPTTSQRISAPALGLFGSSCTTAPATS